jgi:formiminotetrahydrofolate cyclodeaminase
MTLWNATLADFRERIASVSPTPGGGSVASVCATFGLGLLVMALEITRLKLNDVALTETVGEARDLLVKLAAHADRDVAVFQRYMEALALPRSTDAEKNARRTALAERALAAAEAPLEAAGDMLRALSIAERSTRLAKAELASDVLGGADVLVGSIAAVLRNVDINLAALASDELRDRVRAQREEIARRAAEEHARVRAAYAKT